MVAAAAGEGGARQRRQRRQRRRRRRRALRSHSSCRRRRTPPPRGQSAGRPPTRRLVPCAASSSDREIVSSDMEIVSSDKEIVPEAKVSPLGSEGPEVPRALTLILTLNLSLTLTLTRGRWGRRGGAARLRARELRELLAPMADGAAAAGARVHLPHARLCLAAQPRGAPGAAARRRGRSVRAPPAHGRRRRRRLRPLPLPRSALLQHRTLGATRAAAAVRRGRRPAERAERRLAGARLAVPPLPAAVRGGSLHAATTLQPRCNHAATTLQPHALRLQPCAPDQTAGASRVPFQLRARAPQVESCLLCGASPYHRGTSCVEHRAAVAAAAGVAAEQERVVASSSGVAVSES